MPEPRLVIAGKTRLAIEGARAVRAAADARGWKRTILLLPNLSDDGEDGWQPSLARFGNETPGFELIELETVYQLDPLVFFSLEFDRIVKTTRIPHAELFNVHFSLLPAYKGMSTSIWPILEGRIESGVTLHRIDHGIDTGPVVAQVRFPIGPDDTGRDLYLRYLEYGTELFTSHVDFLLDGPESTPQPADGSSYRGARDLDYSNPLPTLVGTAFELRNRIRAFTFPEYQSVVIDGLTITSSRVSEAASTRRAGTVVLREPGRRILATIDFDLDLRGVESQQ